MKSPEVALPQTDQGNALEDKVREPGFFSRFFRAEAPRLRTYLARFVSRADAEELTQEAFMRVFSTQEEIRSPSGFLYRTARNLLVDRKRHEKAGNFVDIEDAVAESVPDPRATPEETTHWRRRLEDAAVVIDHMSPRCREIFLLQVIDGYTYAEIAARMGVSAVAVKKQLLRAFNICTAHAQAEERRIGRRGQRPKQERQSR